MTRITTVLCCLLLALTVMTSCNKEESYTTTLSSDAAITSFALGSLTQYSDSGTVVATLTGSNYKMRIDQLGTVDESGKHIFTIANTDSLPRGTRVTSVVCTVTALNSAGILIKNTADDQYTVYNSSTGIDFSQPRTFRVVSTDGQYTRDYVVTLNVRKSDEKTFSWKERATSPLFADCEKVRLMSIPGKLLAFTVKDNTAKLCCSTDEGTTWTETGWNVNTPLAATVCENVVEKDSMLFLLNNGTLLRSDDGAEWMQVNTTGTPALKQLFGASTGELFAIGTDGALMASADDGTTWRTEKITAASGSKLPTQGLASVRFALNDSTDYVLLAGNDGTNSMVWRKISHYRSVDNSGQWIIMTSGQTNKTPLPLLQHLALVCYESSVLAFSNIEAAYESKDQGITWKASGLYDWADGMLSVTADTKGNLWAVTTAGKVMQGNKH